MALIAVAGLTFTLAARIPFSPTGLRLGPLILALVALLPVLQFAVLWVGARRHWPAWTRHSYLLYNSTSLFNSATLYVAAALVGVSLACAIGARRSQAA